MIIRPEALTRDAFLPFGEVLELENVKPQSINFGNTKKYANLAKIAIADNGFGQLSIYRSSAIDLPFRIHLMECHPLGSQAFYPLHERPFPVIVALPGSAPGPSDIRVFLSNGRQGVNFLPGVWHHYQLTLGQESDYIVVDRGGSGANYEEQCLTEEEVWLDI
jgi:ureidoglycolate lyase